VKRLTSRIVRRVITDHANVEDVAVRARYGALEAWVSIVGNVVLFGIKLTLGLLINSMALIADSLHTLSDTGTSIVLLVGFRVAKKPGDREHPFGHQRMEPIAALVIAVLLLVAAFELLRSSVGRIVTPTVEMGRISWLVWLIVAGTVLAKECMARFARQLGRMSRSTVLLADFWHHRSDALSTLVVLLAFVALRLGWSWVDGLAGAAVALVVGYSGYIVARDAINPLLGERPSTELLETIKSAARQVSGVQGVHDVIVHRYGQLKLVSLHIEVSADEPVQKLHALSEEVEAVLEKHLGGSAVVHIDPIDRRHRRYQEINHAVTQAVATQPQIESFHELRVYDLQQQVHAEFDITLQSGLLADAATTIQQRLAEQLHNQLGDVQLAIKIDPKYAYTR